MLEFEQILEVGVLFFDNGLKCVVEPFTKGVDDASTIGANRLGADWSFVNLNCQVEVPKRIRAILEGNCGGCSQLKIAIRLMLYRSCWSIDKSHSRDRKCIVVHRPQRLVDMLLRQVDDL